MLHNVRECYKAVACPLLVQSNAKHHIGTSFYYEPKILGSREDVARILPGWFRVVLVNLEVPGGPRIVPYEPWAHNCDVLVMRRLPQLELCFENGPLEAFGGSSSSQGLRGPKSDPCG